VNKITVIILTALICLLGAQFAVAADFMPSFNGAAYRDFKAMWVQDVFGFYDFLSYDMDMTAFTKLEGNFSDKKTGLAAGADISVDDNEVGKANKISAYLGIKRLYLRLQKGSMKGTAVWAGTLAPGQSSRTLFDDKFTHVDMLLHSKTSNEYWGLGYTSFSLPAELQTTDSAAVVKRVLDTDFKVKCYSFIFGFDSFSGSEPFEEGIKFFASGEDRFGLGNSEISDQGVTAIKDLNPGTTTVPQNIFTAFVENDTNLGWKWGHDFKAFKMAVGVGYEMSFIVGIQYGSLTTAPGKLDYESPISLFRHGPIGRVFLQF
jgi:hypothetical protein